MISVRTVTTWVLGAGLLLWLGACDGPSYTRSLDGGRNSIDALHIGVAPDGFSVATAADSGGSPSGAGGAGTGPGSGGSGQSGGATDTGNAITGGASGGASTGGMASGTGGAGTGGPETGGATTGGTGGAATGGAATGGAATGGRATGGAATGGAVTGGPGTGGANTGGASTGGAGTGGAPSDTAQYGFETSTQSWGAAAGGQPLTSVDVSTAQRFAGTSSLAVAVTTTAGSSYYVEVAPPTPTIPPSAQVTFHVFIPASAPLTAVEPYVLETGTYRYTARRTLATALNRDAWTTIRVSVPTNAAAILRLGVKLEANGPWTGTVYIDSIGW